MTRNDFIEKVKRNLSDMNAFECGAIGVGISGGADSVALFLAVLEIFKCSQKTCQEAANSVPIIAVTVNHHIRSESETNGDVEFIKSLVEKYKEDFDVRLVVCDLEKDQVRKEAKKRKCGIEEAARFLRYECFEKIIAENHIGCFCLAHNQNDNLETILMRFLQGTSSGGIPSSRGKYVRPLINITRSEIEEFLKGEGQDWRTDSTNYDENYLRNNIRLNLVPVLDEKFPDWRKAVLSGAEKSKIDSDFISSYAEKVFSESRDESSSPEIVRIPSDAFTYDAVSYRILIRAMNELGVTERVPHQFLSDIIFEIKKSVSENRPFSKRFSSVEAGYENHNVFVKKYAKKQTDFGFFDIIKEEGKYAFPFGELLVFRSEKDGFITLAADGKSVTYELDFPFVVRSPSVGEKKQLFVVEG